MQTRAPAATIALAAFSMMAAAQDAKTGDPRVAELLQRAGFHNCKVDDDGDYACAVKVSDTRTQVVWISSTPSRVGDVENRRIFSAAFQSSGSLPVEDLSALLEENARYNFGAWELRNAGGKSTAIFAGHVPLDVSTSQFVAVFSLVAVVADQKELEKSGKDDF